MTHQPLSKNNRLFILTGLGIAVIIAVGLSPFASQNPDGLNRVAQDLKFADKASETPPAKKLPFASVFQQYSLKGVPKNIATPLGGLIGTLITFGVGWGLGKLAVKKKSSHGSDSNSSE